jgi:hypothetical protein
VAIFRKRLRIFQKIFFSQIRLIGMVNIFLSKATTFSPVEITIPHLNFLPESASKTLKPLRLVGEFQPFGG